VHESAVALRGFKQGPECADSPLGAWGHREQYVKLGVPLDSGPDLSRKVRCGEPVEDILEAGLVVNCEPLGGPADGHCLAGGPQIVDVAHLVDVEPRDARAAVGDAFGETEVLELADCLA